jgi:hypothetical protein
MLCSSGGLGDESKEDFTRIGGGVTQAPVQHLSADGRLGLDMPCVPAVISTDFPALDRPVLALLPGLWPRLESVRLSGVVQEMHRNAPRAEPPEPHMEEDEPQEAEVVDLLAALRASVEAAKKQREEIHAVLIHRDCLERRQRACDIRR